MGCRCGAGLAGTAAGRVGRLTGLGPPLTLLALAPLATPLFSTTRPCCGTASSLVSRSRPRSRSARIVQLLRTAWRTSAGVAEVEAAAVEGGFELQKIQMPVKDKK